jgi:hypothetical protein
MILLKDFCKDDAVCGIRKITTDLNFLYNYCDLTDVDNMILSQSGSSTRRLELLNVRALIKELNLNLSITYKARKPVCNNGFIGISHSDSLVAVIWSEKSRFAIDIEEISDRITRIAKRAFSQDELDFADNNTEKLNLLWNCKECVYKLANIVGLDFKQQIKVIPFLENERIICELTHDNIISVYQFEYGIILNHTFVWGKQI